MKPLVRLIVCFIVVAAPAFAQESPIDYETARFSRAVTAIRVTEKVSIDGKLEETAWQIAVPASDFTQWAPRNGEPSHERTEVRFLYDDDNLYIGAYLYDSDVAHAVVNQLKEDFRTAETDGLSIQIDGVHDGRSAFIFTTNPAGARRDAQSVETQLNDDWDAVWDVKTSINSDGWIAEYVIPFKTLRFKEDAIQEWGLNMSRRILRINEDSTWSPIPVRYRAATRMSLAGTLNGLENIRQGRNLKVKPFVTAGVTQLHTGTTTQTHTDQDGGVDVKYGLSESLTLDATYRTDFAQVEVDQQQVNLTRFNVLFPEKREFFLENAGTFAFGGGGNLIPFFSRRIGLSSAGLPVPILGGARISGKARGYDLGLLAMKTESAGTVRSNNYLVGRVKRNFWNNSWIGSLVTHRDSTASGDYNRVYGADAYLQFFDRLDFNTFLLKSDTPDKSGRNQARKFETGWRDEDYTVSASYNTVQPNFNPETGFIRRRNVTQYSGEASWRPRLRRSRTIQNLNFATGVDYYESSGTGQLETRTQSATVGVDFQNRGSASVTIDQTFDRLTSDFQIRPDIVVPPGDYKYLTYDARVGTDPGKSLSGNANVNWGDFWDGRRRSFTGEMVIRPNYHLNVELSYNRNMVKLPNGEFTTDLAGARFIYGFTPRSFLNAYFQYNADTHQVSSNIRFNFMHHPLSDLYIVYNDRRDTSRGELVERALIVKLTNLFNF